MVNFKTFQDISELKKISRFNEKLHLDARDNAILAMVSNNQDSSQEEIALKIKLSQPSVGARLRKLHEKGVLSKVYGINYKVVDLYLAKIDVNTTNKEAIIEKIRYSPFFVNALITSGRYNLCLFLTATDLIKLEEFVRENLQGNRYVKDMEMNLVISIEKDMVMPLNITNSNSASNRSNAYANSEAFAY
ncbi:MAG: winged helix-turn-helix transcriptional regulator [archaeon]